QAKPTTTSGERPRPVSDVRFLNIEACANASHCPDAREERAIDNRLRRRYGTSCAQHEVNLIVVYTRGARNAVTRVESECLRYKHLPSDEIAARVVPGPLPPSLERLASGR